MLDQTTKRRIDSARDILVGKIPDPKAQVEQITTALVYKFMDDMDKKSEEAGGKKSFFTGEFSQYAWSKLMDRKLSGEERLDLYVRAIANMPKNPHIPPLFRDILKEAFLPFRDARTLNLFLKKIDEFSYDHHENLGNAYEYLLSIMGSQGDAGQFRTPRHIIDFIVEAVAPQKNDTILDPACGTAGFLISAYKHILRTNEDKPLTPKDKKTLMKNLKGYDIAPDMVKLALMNMYLHKYPNPQIYEYDSLTDDIHWDEIFDVILANPPFMTPKGGITPHRKFSIAANRSEVLFVDYIAEHLSIRGRAGIIVPEGIIFQAANAYKRLRENLIENWGLYAVVSLPSGVFKPYSGVKTSILLLDRELAKSTAEMVFVQINHDGFDLGDQRREIDKNDLPDCLDALQRWKREQVIDEDNKFAFAVAKSKIAADGDYNLTGNRYRETVDYNNTKWQMVKLGDVCEIKPSKQKAKSQVNDNGLVSFVPMGDLGINKKIVVPKQKKKLKDVFGNYTYFRDDDVLLAKITPCFENGKLGIAKNLENGIGFGSTEFIVLRCSDEISNDYLYYLLLQEHFRDLGKKSMSGAAGQQRLDKDFVRNFSIPLPPLEVQEQIVAEIEGYQNVIDGARQVIDSWKPSFRIDPNWQMVALGEVCEVISGQSPKGKYYNENQDGMPFYQGKTEFQDMYIDEPQKWTTQITKIATKNDILMSVRAPVGPINFATQEICIGRGLASIRGNKEKINQRYLFYILRNKESSIQGNAGAKFASINRDDIQKIKIPLPPLEVQDCIVSEIEAERAAIQECKKLIASMEKKIKAKIGEVWGDAPSSL